MRDPLNQQAARRATLVEHTSRATQIGGRETPQLSMHEHTSRIRRFNTSRTRRSIVRRRAPDMHFITGRRQPRRHQLRVITAPARLRRILARDQMPVR